MKLSVAIQYWLEHSGLKLNSPHFIHLHIVMEIQSTHMVLRAFKSKLYKKRISHNIYYFRPDGEIFNIN